MQAKNYTNPQDRGRFGFSMSGEYRAPYKAETALVVLLIGIAIGAGVAIFFIFANYAEKINRDEQTGAFFFTIAIVVALLLFLAILIVVFGVGLRSVKKGFVCKYTANDETFTTTIGGDLHVIQYSEVTSINFKARSSLGKIRGYDVTIKVNGKDEYYSVCSDGYLSPRSTPFYIIQERIDILHQQHSSAPINAARADTKAITRAEVDRAKTGSISAMDKMAQLLGETSNMPELSASASPTERAVAEVNKLMNEYPSAEMPSIGRASRSHSADVFIDDMGRQHSINETQAQGSFYVRLDARIEALITLVVMLLSGGLFVFLWSVADIYVNMLPYPLNMIVFWVLFAIVEGIAFYNAATKTRSPIHNYNADGRAFYVTIKGKGQEQILYKDVLSVDYKSTKFLWGYRGYKVDILTTYGVIHYDYLFPRFNHRIILKNLPFDIIKRNIPNREETDQ